MKDYEHDCEDEEDKQDDLLGIEFHNDAKSNFFSQINYDQYEIQYPLMEDLEGSGTNLAGGTCAEKLESSDEWQRDYSLMFEIFIGQDGKERNGIGLNLNLNAAGQSPAKNAKLEQIKK